MTDTIAVPDRRSRPQLSGSLRMEWTDERISVLKTLWAEGLATRVIADELGVTKNAVIGKAHRLGLERRPCIVQRKPAPVPVPWAVWKVEGPAPAAKPAGAFLKIPLLALRPWQCRYARGEGPFFFCGQPRQDGSSYCPKHHAACHHGWVRR